MSVLEKVAPTDLDLFDASWLEPISSVKKVEFRKMLQRIETGEWWVWRFKEPSSGIAVAYPEDGKLFIYYLRGYNLFANLHTEDLLEAARAEGLKGCMAETSRKGILLFLKRLGFKVIFRDQNGWLLELEDG